MSKLMKIYKSYKYDAEDVKLVYSDNNIDIYLTLREEIAYIANKQDEVVFVIENCVDDDSLHFHEGRVE
jgi:hypothetical protein